MWSFRAALLMLLIGDGIPPLQMEAPLQNSSHDGIPPLQTEVLIEFLRHGGIPPLQRWTLPQNFCDAVIPLCRHLHVRKTACRHAVMPSSGFVRTH